MNPEPSTPEPHVPEAEPAPAHPATSVPTSVLVLGFIAVVLLGVLVAVSLKDKPEKGGGTEDPSIKEMKGRLQALQNNVNQDRAKLGLSPLYNSDTTESAEAVAKRITDDAATLVALSKGVSDLITTKDAERSQTAKELAEALGILAKDEGVAFRATFIVDPDNVIQHVTVNGLNVGRNPQETLRVLDALQTDELCPCNWSQGEEVLKPAA